MKKFILTVLFLAVCSAGWCANKYVTPAGAGLMDGSDWDNAFGLTEFLTDLASVSAGDIYYVMSGTYTFTSTFTSSVSATGNAFVEIIGVSDEALTEAEGVNRPVFTMGAYFWGQNHYYYRFRNIYFTGTGTYVMYGIGLRHQFLNCSFVNTSASADRYGLRSSVESFYYRCHFESTNGTGALISNLSSNQSLIYCTFKGGMRGITGSGNLIGCIVYDSTDGVVVYNDGGRIVNCTIYNCSGNGIDVTDRKQIIVSNTIISNCGVGINMAAASTYKETNLFTGNNFYNNTMDISDDDGVTETNTYKKGINYSLDPQFTDAANGDFSIGTNLKGLGFPGTYPDINTTGYMDIGAVQREELESSGGGEHSAVYVY